MQPTDGADGGAAPVADVFGSMLEVNEDMLAVAAECHARGDVEGAIAYQRLLHRNLVEMATFVDARFGVYTRSEPGDDSHGSDSSEESDVSMDDDSADETDIGGVGITAGDRHDNEAHVGVADTGATLPSALLETLAADEVAKVKQRSKKMWMRAREQVREQEAATAAQNEAAERMATVTAGIIKKAAVLPAPTVAPETLAIQTAFQLKVSAALAAFAASALAAANAKATGSSANASTSANLAGDVASIVASETQDPTHSEVLTPSTAMPENREAAAAGNVAGASLESVDDSAAVLTQTAQLAVSPASNVVPLTSEVPAGRSMPATDIPSAPEVSPLASPDPESVGTSSIPVATNNAVSTELGSELAAPTNTSVEALAEQGLPENNAFAMLNTTKMALPPSQSLVNVMYPVAGTMYPPMQLSTICPVCALQNKTATECRMVLKHVTPSILLDPTMISGLGFQWPPVPPVMDTQVAPARPPVSTLPVVSRRQTAESTGFKRMCEACRKCHQSVHRCRVVLQHTAPEWQPTTQAPPRRGKPKKGGNPKTSTLSRQ